MTLTYIVFAALLLSLFSCAWLFSSRYYAFLWPEAHAAGHSVSWLILVLSLASRIVMFQRREDSAALLNVGLSVQNSVQIVLTLVGLVWAANLIVRHRVRASDLLAGPAFWMSILVFVYALSSFWSLWPALTIYRATELAVFWVLSIHIFANRNWIEHFERMLWVIIGLHWINGIVTGANTFLDGNIVSAIHDNAGSEVAATGVIFSVFRITLENCRRNWAKLFVSALSLVVFGSLSSTAALVCALVVFIAYYSLSSNRALTAILLCTAGVMVVCQLALMFLGDVSDLLSSGVVSAGATLNKTPAMLANWTGRLPLWAAVWDSTKGTLWGDGFAAAERLFALNHPSFGWQARHSHNGYIAAWMGAGWIGFLLVLFLFGSVWVRSKRLLFSIRVFVTSALVLFAINNLTLPTIGGTFNQMFALMMGLTCISRIWAIEGFRTDVSEPLAQSNRS